jgi:hypothetical protein
MQRLFYLLVNTYKIMIVLKVETDISHRWLQPNLTKLLWYLVSFLPITIKLFGFTIFWFQKRIVCTKLDIYVFIRERRKGNQEWKIQKHRLHWTQDTERRQANKKHNTENLRWIINICQNTDYCVDDTQGD